MRWLPFMLIAGVVLILQATIAPRLELYGSRPDWLLVLVVVVALHARMADAALGAWIVGACADLMTIERCGLIAISYVLLTTAVIAVREFLFCRRAITQFVVTLIIGIVIHGAWLMYRRTMYPSTLPVFDDMVVRVLFVAVYTAMWAPPIHACLLRLRKPLGFTAPRFRYAP